MKLVLTIWSVLCKCIYTITKLKLLKHKLHLWIVFVQCIEIEMFYTDKKEYLISVVNQNFKNYTLTMLW